MKAVSGSRRLRRRRRARNSVASDGEFSPALMFAARVVKTLYFIAS